MLLLRLLRSIVHVQTSKHVVVLLLLLLRLLLLGHLLIHVETTEHIVLLLLRLLLLLHWLLLLRLLHERKATCLLLLRLGLGWLAWTGEQVKDIALGRLGLGNGLLLLLRRWLNSCSLRLWLLWRSSSSFTGRLS